MARKRRQQSGDRDAFGVIAAGLVGIAGGLYGLSKEEEARALAERLARAEAYGKRLLQVRNDERAAFLRLQEESRMLRRQNAELEAELQRCRREMDGLREAGNRQGGV
jgi:chromosome segregation ATPase